MRSTANTNISLVVMFSFALQKNNKIGAFVLFSCLLLGGCKEEPVGDLSTLNLRFRYDYTIFEVDSSLAALPPNYCFEIYHDKGIDLSKYHLVIDITGKKAYSGAFRKKIEFPMMGSRWNSMAVALYDTIDKVYYSWTNKDSYDFKTKDKKCYEIKLYSEKNIDHGDSEYLSVR